MVTESKLILLQESIISKRVSLMKNDDQKKNMSFLYVRTLRECDEMRSSRMQSCLVCECSFSIRVQILFVDCKYTS